jgi:large subunit ribosomal protein L24
MAKQRFQPKLHVKRGDNVMVISGDHKGSSGVIVKVFVEENRAIVEGVNMVKRHNKATATQPAGIVEKEAPIHISNLMHLDPKSGEPTRIGRRLEEGKLVRFSKKSNLVIK